MNDEFTPERIQALYERGVSYKTGLGLYETVQRNERFYTGDQWHGLQTKKIQPVVLNVLRRVVGTFQAMVVSDDISFQITPFLDSDERETAGKVLEESVKTVIEKQKIKTLNRKCIRTGATTGDMCMYFHFDPDVETGQMVKGDIAAEVLLGTSVIFGDPFSIDVQKQPYILIARRRPVEIIRKEAKEKGVKDWEEIQSDNGGRYIGDDDDAAQELATELTCFWKVRKEEADENGIAVRTVTEVHWMRTAGKVQIVPETPTKMTLYPIAWANWLERLNSMHGISPITEAISTQIAINKQFTNILSFTQNLAYPKIVYDKRKFPNGWDGSPGTAVGVVGDPRELTMNAIGGLQMPQAVVAVLEMMIRLMKDCLGASDASLGDVRPENTSAILAAQSASNAPLELQKRTFEQFNEDCVRIIIDMMCAHYGKRAVNISVRHTDPITGLDTEEDVIAELDFGSLSLGAMDVNVEVGASSYWSQTVAVTNLDKLMMNQLLPDMLTYFEGIPSTMLPNKREIIRKVKEKMKRDAMAQQTAPMQAGAGGMMGG
ncbi:MAG: hypothetical protein KH050_05905 [Clostridiaceae bacterium]|nr:hypothetical protein [Clostridiaceae bacterium]